MGFFDKIGKVITSGVGSVLGGLVSGVGSIISTKMSNHAAKDAQKREQRYLQENMALQNQYNIEAFERENAYNAPVAQRERMREAGLNPNFADGSSAIAQQDSNVSASAPKQQVFPFDFSQIANAAATFASIKRDNKLAESQIETNKSIQFKNESDALLAESNRGLNDTLERAQNKIIDKTQKEIDKLTNDIARDNKALELSEEELNIKRDEVASTIDLNDAKIKNMDDLFKLALEKAPHEIKQLDADAQLKWAQSVCAQILANNDTQRVGIERYNSITNRMNANETTRHNKAQEMIAKERADYQNALDVQLGALYHLQGVQVAATNARAAFAHAIESILLKRGYTQSMYWLKYKQAMLTVDNLLTDKFIKKEELKKIEMEVIKDLLTLPADIASPYLDNVNKATDAVGNVIPFAGN